MFAWSDRRSRRLRQGFAVTSPLAHRTASTRRCTEVVGAIAECDPSPDVSCGLHGVFSPPVRSPIVYFRMLGPVEAVDTAGVVDLGAPQLRALLARLLLSTNQVVAADALLDALWESRDDASVRNLRVYVSRLRKAVGGAEVLATRAPGYILHADGDQVDALRFERMLRRGRDLIARDEAPEAAEVLREALALWRGPALADQRDRAFAVGDAVRLDAARLDAMEERVEADLRCGRHGALVGELRGLVVEHPLRERLWRQRMLAEHRAGQTTDALRTFQELRALLAEELGLDPSAETVRLEQAILQQDPTIEWKSSTPTHAADDLMPTSENAALRVMLVDDHPLWRTALRGMLERDQTVKVVAEAEDGPSAVSGAAASDPDVVVMDLHLPGITGAEATRQIVAASPRTRVLMLSASGDEADVLDALKAGAAGYLLKSGDGEAVIDGVRRASRGEPVFTSSLAGVVLDRLRGEDRSGGHRVELSVGQRELLRRLASGASVVEAAASLGVDETAVREDLAVIVERLQAAEGAGPATRRLQTLFFVDVVGSTAWVADAGDRAWRAVIGRLQEVLRRAAATAGGRVVKDTGDGALLVFDRPGPALACAGAVVAELAALGLLVRAGLHSGECEVADDDVLGLAVHIASRVLDQAADGEVLVSHTVRDLVRGSDVRFEDRGTHRLRGVPDRWRLYALVQ